MGTLTANQTRLPEYCEHKLPTSCRLSSISNCCACADERAHAASYSTYIDGIGFVLRGTRWQRYCWFCKEFWEERVRVSGLRSGQTKIPDNPDQTDFLRKWYEFHQGYRIVTKDDGTEERVAVLGEEFKDVSPGCLPRTLEELRSGRRREEDQQVQNNVVQDQADSGPSIEDTLEQMFAAVSAESNRPAAQPTTTAVRSTEVPALVTQEPATMVSNIHAQAMNPAGSRNREYQMRRVAALRRELNRMRNGIERVITGLRDLGEDVPNHSETTGRLTALGDTLDTISGAPSSEEAQRAMESVNELTRPAPAQTEADRTIAAIQTRVDEARTRMDEARQARDQAASELDFAEQEFRTSQHRFHQIQREQRSTENYMRIFGTREEMITQGENYVSPIGSMFTRADERFRAAEEVRREQRTLRQVLEDETRAGGEHAARRLSELEDRQRDVWGVPHPSMRATTMQIVRDSLEQSLQRPDSLLNEAANTTVEPSLAETDVETPPMLVPTAEESQLEEYYAMLRQQDQRQAEPNNGVSSEQSVTDRDSNQQHPVNSFTQNMLSAIVAARERELAERNDQDRSAAAPSAPLPAEDVPPPFQMGWSRFSADEWWHQDAVHIIRALTTDDEFRNEISISPQEASVLLAYFMDDVLPENERTTIDGLMRNPTVVWRTGLPAEWLKRRINDHPDSDFTFFTGGANANDSSSRDWAENYNAYMATEIVAQAYQMSASIRYLDRVSTPPERLQLLYRLQAGRRDEADLRTLEVMHNDRDIWTQVLLTWRERFVPSQRENRDTEARLTAMMESRRATARNGDYSRNELDARRRDTTQAFALAAGRQAMQEGSQALFERLADEGGSNRTAAEQQESANYLGRPPPIRINAASGRTILHRAMRRTDITSDSDTDSDSDADVPEPTRGLDALNTGRPEPKEDEELMLQMDCKICYTQIAEIACLPCGHLVMCRWCSEQHSPTMEHDRTRPRRAAACPVCRKGVRQKYRVFRA